MGRALVSGGAEVSLLCHGVWLASVRVLGAQLSPVPSHARVILQPGPTHLGHAVQSAAIPGNSSGI